MPHALPRIASALWIAALVVPMASAGVPDGGELILAPQPTSTDGAGMKVIGDQAALGRLEIVPASVPGFDHAYRVAVNTLPDRRWNVQLAGDIDQPISAGSVYLLSFYARCIESTTGDGTVTVKVERNQPDWTNTLARAVSFGKDWTRFDLPFVVDRSRQLEAGEAHLTFHLGEAIQTVELGGIELRDYADCVALADLPRTRMTYTGIEPDAPWRAEAAQRIDRLRKAELRVRVVDASGKPVSDATVHIEQQRHAFVFGTAMNLRYASSGDPGVPQYLEALRERFNAVVFENELKWHGPGLRNPEAVDLGLSFVEEHGLFFRGHTLVWPGSRHLPQDVNLLIQRLREMPDDEAARQQLNQMVADRITSMASRLTGRVDDWDVVNEPYSNHDLMEMLDPPGTPHGSGVMAEWFRLADAADPDAKLFLNDYGILTAGEQWSGHQQHFYDTARQLIDAGAPIDGLGMQGHFGGSLTTPERLWAILNRYSELGLRIKVTEYDLDTDDPQLLADYTRDFYTAMFAHPSVDGVLSWGFWAGAHWRPRSAYLNRDFSPRPHDRVLRDLIFNQWWTRAELTTSSDGVAQVRAFKGLHDVRVEAPNHEPVALRVNLSEPGQTFTVRLSQPAAK